MIEKLNLRVGDEVYLFKHNGWYMSYRKAKVDKITPTGIITIGNQRFNPEGYERGKKYSGEYIKEINKESKKIITDIELDESHRGNCNYLLKVNFKHMDREFVAKICKLVREQQEKERSQNEQ